MDLSPWPTGLPRVLWVRTSRSMRDIWRHRRNLEFKYPFAAAEVVKLFREYFGPTRVAFSRLDSTGQQGLAADLERLWAEHNEGSANETHVQAEYLEVIARKA